MAKIWSWGVAAFSDLHVHIEYVRTTTFEQGLNLFAQVHLTRFVVGGPATGTKPAIQGFISNYAVWNPDGSQSTTALSDQPTVAFIRNCAWVEVALAVSKGQAAANLTLIEWT
jgi:hypothetical protein